MLFASLYPSGCGNESSYLSLAALQHVEVGHGDAAEHRADDTEEALVGAGEVEVVQMCATVFDFVRCAVDGSVQVAGELAHRAWSEHVLGDAVIVERELAIR